MKLFVVIAAVAAAFSASPVWAKGASEGSMREPKIRERSAAPEKAAPAKAEKAAPAKAEKAVPDCGPCLKEAGIRAAGTALIAGAASIASGVGVPTSALTATAAGTTTLWVEARNCAAACDRTMQREAVRSEKPAPVERTVNENPKFGRSF
jgi:hypothetical protein